MIAPHLASSLPVGEVLLHADLFTQQVYIEPLLCAGCSIRCLGAWQGTKTKSLLFWVSALTWEISGSKQGAFLGYLKGQQQASGCSGLNKREYVAAGFREAGSSVSGGGEKWRHACQGMLSPDPGPLIPGRSEPCSSHTTAALSCASPNAFILSGQVI